MGYNAFGAKPSDPVPGPNAVVMRNGTIVGEDFANLAKELYPNCIAEEPSSAKEFISGSVDIYIPEEDLLAYRPNWRGGNAVVEIKTMGRWGFDDQIGVKSTSRKILDSGSGPKLGAIIQAGVNALGLEQRLGVTINTLILVSETFENLSIQKSVQMGIDLNDYTRMAAEWHFERSYWEPLVQSELLRMARIAEQIEYGFLPERIAGDDDGQMKELNPLGSDWQCHYCSHRETCKQDGRASISVTDSSLEKL